MAVRLQRLADHADAAVHHVGGRDDVRARRRLVERLAHQHIDRRIVDDIAVGIEQPVLSMRRIGVERDVGQQADVHPGIADRADRAAHQIVGIERLRPVVAAQRRRGVREEREAGNASGRRFPRALDDPVDRPARYAGKRGDGFCNAVALGDEQRPDEIRGRQPVLGEHRPAPGARARPAQAKGGIGGDRRFAHPIPIGPRPRGINGRFGAACRAQPKS